MKVVHFYNIVFSGRDKYKQLSVFLIAKEVWFFFTIYKHHINSHHSGNFTESIRLFSSLIQVAGKA